MLPPPRRFGSLRTFRNLNLDKAGTGMLRTGTLLFIGVFLASAASFAETTLIKAGRLLDPESGALRTSQSILIEGKTIKAVDADVVAPQDARVIDLSQFTVLPGLMDAHTHLCWHINDRRGDGYVLSIVREPTPYRAIQGVMNARDMLLSGFTTVRDVGNAANYADTALRLAVEDRLVPGPTIINAGRIIAPFGGQRWVIPERRDFTQPEYFFADTRDELKKAVRENIHFGAKVIKLVVDDQPYRYSEEDIRFVVQEAELSGLKVAAHCSTEQGAVNAIKAGVHSIEHNMTPAAVRLAKKHGVWLVTTPFSLPVLQAMGSDLRRSPQDTYQDVVQRMQAVLREDAPLAFGADVIAKTPGLNRGEATLSYIQSYLDAGATSLQILRAMTVNAAKAIAVDDTRGSIKAGFYADIIAVAGNPLEDVNALKKVRFVMKEGEIHKSEL